MFETLYLIKNNMKILIVNYVFWPNQSGGSQISTKILAEKLVEHGHSVTVLTCDNREHVEYHNGVCIYYLKVSDNFLNLPLNYTRLYYRVLELYNIFLIKKVHQTIKSIAPDVIHTNCIQILSISVFDIAAKLKIPIIHTARDFHLICPHSMIRDNVACSSFCLSCKFYSFLRKRHIRKITSFVSISKFMMRTHEERNLFSDKIHKYVVYNSVPDNLEWNQNSNQCLSIGYMGRITKDKGIELLLDSFCRIEKKELTLIIAGDGNCDYVKKLKQKYSSKRIKWMGIMNQNEFYRSIDLLVVPSLWQEPFGRVVVEAIYANRPVLVSNRGGMPEILNKIPFGDIFNVEDPDSLYNKLNEIIKDQKLYQSFFKADRQTKIFSNEYVTSKYEEIYLDAIRYYNLHRMNL